MGVRADSAGWVTQSLHVPRKGLLDDGCLWNVLTDQCALHPFAWILHTESLRMASICLLLASGASVMDPQEKLCALRLRKASLVDSALCVSQLLSCVSSWGALEAVSGLPQTGPNAFPGLTVCPFALTN